MLIPPALRPSAYFTRVVGRSTHSVVQGGPFAGMAYVDRAFWGAYIPKLLGTYECELCGAIEAAIDRQPALIVDVGGAEGYYAVGLALRVPSARVVVFEQHDTGRQMIAELAARNSVRDRVSILGTCDPSSLREALSGERGHPLVLCDVEGYEVELLNDVVVPLLRHATVIVETHDFAVRDCTSRLCDRFSDTHDIEVIAQARRDSRAYPFRHGFGRSRKLVERYALNEFRPSENGWLAMTPKRRE